MAGAQGLGQEAADSEAANTEPEKDDEQSKKDEQQKQEVDESDNIRNIGGARPRFSPLAGATESEKDNEAVARAASQTRPLCPSPRPKNKILSGWPKTFRDLFGKNRDPIETHFLTK